MDTARLDRPRIVRRHSHLGTPVYLLAVALIAVITIAFHALNRPIVRQQTATAHIATVDDTHLHGSAPLAIAHPLRLTTSFTPLASIVLAFGGLLIYRALLKRLARSAEQLTEASTVDTLTRVLNRTAFLKNAQAQLSRSRQACQPVALVVANLDYFRRINQLYGNDIGDLALRHFAAIVQSHLHNNDLVGRLAGEEFALLLNGTELDVAILAAERIRERLAGSTAVIAIGNTRVSVTCSFGVAVAQPNESFSDLLARAHALLQLAQRDARNRVVASPEHSETSVVALPTAPLRQRHA